MSEGIKESCVLLDSKYNHGAATRREAAAARRIAELDDQAERDAAILVAAHEFGQSYRTWTAATTTRRLAREAWEAAGSPECGAEWDALNAAIDAAAIASSLIAAEGERDALRALVRDFLYAAEAAENECILAWSIDRSLSDASRDALLSAQQRMCAAYGALEAVLAKLREAVK